MNDEKLWEDDLFDLTVPGRHFFLLSISKIDDQMIWLLWGLLQINGS